ncbi:TetR family transcriptional regulator [Pseudomonas sp. 1D4]|uniref:TetR/AcrR family transcriptional regulator n=1 Tax=Pseudomonas sp. 1D4 TaxID=1843691 RepID=UPI00084B76B1|nr:TetR/AcrR family transcriptional regulator [Pseudomonas sp. 1D4]OEC46752.1 TetR family transcriptional regulator [Pseudomonas sp. 1D4]
MEGGERGAVLAVFEDLGGYGAVARQQGEGGGPLVGHLLKTNIQLAAIPVFARKGIDDTTVNDLLEAARVSRRTFYKHFANKMDVLACIYQTSVVLLLERFRALREASGSDEAWLRAMVRCFFDYHLAVGPIIRLMQEEAMRSGSPLASHRRRAHEALVALLDERLRISGPALEPLTGRALIWALEAASLDLLASAAPRAQIEQATAVLGDLLIAALRPQAGPV